LKWITNQTVVFNIQLDYYYYSHYTKSVDESIKEKENKNSGYSNESKKEIKSSNRSCKKEPIETRIELLPDISIIEAQKTELKCNNSEEKIRSLLDPVQEEFNNKLQTLKEQNKQLISEYVFKWINRLQYRMSIENKGVQELLKHEIEELSNTIKKDRVKQNREKSDHAIQIKSLENSINTSIRLTQSSVERVANTIPNIIEEIVLKALPMNVTTSLNLKSNVHKDVGVELVLNKNKTKNASHTGKGFFRPMTRNNARSFSFSGYRKMPKLHFGYTQIPKEIIGYGLTDTNKFQTQFNNYNRSVV